MSSVGRHLMACWSVKGGSGTSTVAAALALLVARSSSEGVVLVDLGGDLSTVFGNESRQEPGVHDWLASGAGHDSLESLAVELGPGLRLMPQGRPTESEASGRLVEALLALDNPVVVDCGPPDNKLGRAVAAAAPMSLLVMRTCFLALRRAVASSTRPTDIVVVEEPGHPIRARDIAESLGFPMVTSLSWHPDVARAVDAATLVRRLPRPLSQALRPLFASREVV